MLLGEKNRIRSKNYSNLIGVIASCQERKNQIQNMEAAMNMINLKLYFLKQQQNEVDLQRKNQISAGERTEKKEVTTILKTISLIITLI